VQAQRQFEQAHQLCAEMIVDFDSKFKHVLPQQATRQAAAAAQASTRLPEEAAPAIAEEAAPAMPHELMLALAKLDDSELRREFDAHADVADNEGGRRMSKDGLAKFMREKKLAHGDAEVKRVMARADTNADGEMDFGEFRALARANSEVEQVLRSMHLECLVAASFPSDTTLDKLGKMDDAQLSAVVDKSRPALIQLLRDLRAQLAAAGSAQSAAEGGKFASELKGGTLDDFYQGVTGLCGEPDADLEAGPPICLKYAQSSVVPASPNLIYVLFLFKLSTSGSPCTVPEFKFNTPFKSV